MAEKIYDALFVCTGNAATSIVAHALTVRIGTTSA